MMTTTTTTTTSSVFESLGVKWILDYVHEWLLVKPGDDDQNQTTFTRNANEQLMTGSKPTAAMNGGTVNGIGHGVGAIQLADDNDEDTLVYQDTTLVSGSLDALIQHLVPTPAYCPERSFSFAFLLCARLYISPAELLGRVRQICFYQQNLHSERVTKDTLGRFGPYVVQLLSEWTDNFAYDFRDEKMMAELKQLTQIVVDIYPALRRDVTLFTQNLVAKLNGLQKYEDLLARINTEVSQRQLACTILPSPSACDVAGGSPLVLAQQLTHIELERLGMIGPEEFVQAFVKEKAGDKNGAGGRSMRANNLDAYVNWFNRLTYFVATEICMHLKKKHRVQTIDYFVDVAKECINIGNFNSLMAIVGGLNLSSVQRLKKTWAKVNRDKFEILEHQMDPSSNFGSYRMCLRAALWRSTTAASEREKIVIPFFSLFLKDIHFLNEGCNSRLENNHVNFEKIWQLAKQATEFMSWKQVECPFDRHPAVLNYALTAPVFDEETLTLASYECEQPENSYEKERYKQLKEQYHVKPASSSLGGHARQASSGGHHAHERSGSTGGHERHASNGHVAH